MWTVVSITYSRASCQLLSVYEERADAKAIGLNSFVCKYRFIATMLLHCDTLPVVSHLSKFFQLKNCDYSIVLSSTISSLEQLKTADGINLSNLQSFLDQLQQTDIGISKPSHLAEEYFDQKIRQPYLSAFIENLKKV